MSAPVEPMTAEEASAREFLACQSGATMRFLPEPLMAALLLRLDALRATIAEKTSHAVTRAVTRPQGLAELPPSATGTKQVYRSVKEIPDEVWKRLPVATKEALTRTALAKVK